MSAAYSSLPTANGNGPNSTKDLLSRLTNTAPPTRIRRLCVFVAVLLSSSALLFYLVYPSSFPLPSGSGSGWGSSWYGGSGSGYSGGYNDEALGNSEGGIGPDGPASPFFRDAHPALHARLFLARAQAEIKARGLDTCGGQLSGRMIEGYLDNAVPYCVPAENNNALAEQASGLRSAITCFPAGAASPGSSPNHWWPYPQAFCTSQSLAHTPGWGGGLNVRGSFTGGCKIGDEGEGLKKGMEREVFLGSEFKEDPTTPCTTTITHPVLFVPRQDRWNPFHVGEDLVTTFLALTLFSRTPSLSPTSHSPEEQRLWTALPSSWGKQDEFNRLASALASELHHTENLQLMFQDEYLPTASLFAPLYDRIGAFPAKRWGGEGVDNTCLTRAFHSVGAGASLLSGTRVGLTHTCASELVWGASLWLRWVWGFEALPARLDSLHNHAMYDERRRQVADLERRAPVDTTTQVAAGDPIQVLFLSREKFDEYTKHTASNHRLTGWQEARHISNEGALLKGLREGLSGLCRVATKVPGTTGTHTPGTHDCVFTDADELPGSWGVRMHPAEGRALGRAGMHPPHTSSSLKGEGTANERRSPSNSSFAWAPRGRAHAARAREHNARAALPRAVRFAALDPTTAALPAQLGAVGRADVVVSVHAGALGLTLFMPTGRASVVEMITSGAQGNWHFHNMAHMMGMEYVRLDVQKEVDVPKVVQAVREVVERRLRK
ncbi:hypothetical protein MSAN_00212100 [Mycena sanguinolenta]|uniref:Uncharacterized protein n=1 Tax=Mycena sanguinolenta TaxID=230812 RepID=A0A8H6ZLW5_9AGAR|nr:hypothetical protein MSAN_00212100 [Mycena sanguinolenta]